MLAGINFSIPKFIRYFLVLSFVLLAWVPFRATNMQHAMNSYSALLNPGWQLFSSLADMHAYR